MKSKVLLVAILALASSGVVAGEIVEIRNKEDDIAVLIDVIPFAAGRHKLEFRGDGNDPQGDSALWKVDGARFSGTDGSIPIKEIASFRLLVGNKCFQVPDKAFRLLFQPGLIAETYPLEEGYRASRPAALRREHGKILFVWGGGDGAGSYSAYWEFYLGKGSVKRTIYEMPEDSPERVDYFSLVACVQSPVSPEEPPRKKDE